MSTKKFSEKLIISARKDLNTYMKHPRLLRLFITGEGQNDEKGIEWYCEEMAPLTALAINIIDNSIARSTDEDKAFFEKLHSLSKQAIDTMSAIYVEKFGAVSSDAQQIKQQSWLSYGEHMKSLRTNNEVAMFFLATTWLKQKVSSLTKIHPNYEPNPCFDIIYGFPFQPLVDEIRAFVDRIGATIDSDEEALLTRVFHQCLQQEINKLNVE